MLPSSLMIGSPSQPHPFEPTPMRFAKRLWPLNSEARESRRKT
ncbi:MAG: hypothetical protein OJF48_003056 [Afipia sp.]|nr:MAG: hypothetical protein OJF48_003056 [Afipia sp.]